MKRKRRRAKFSRQRRAEMRAIALFHYGRVCLHCHTTRGPFEVDHKVPISEFPEGFLLLTNLQVLCVPCHIKKHRH